MVTGLAMLGATLVGGGPLLASQAGVSAVIVATIEPPGESFSFDRFVDALIGSGVALLVSAPASARGPARRWPAAESSRCSPAWPAALDEIAAALEARDIDAAERALVVASEVQPEYERLREYLAAAGETARLTPGRRDAPQAARARYEVGRPRDRPGAVERARAGPGRHARDQPRRQDAARGGGRPCASWPNRCAPSAPTSTATEPPEDRARAAMQAAGLANAVLEQTDNLSAVHIVGPAAADRRGPDARRRLPTRAEAQEAVRGADVPGWTQSSRKPGSPSTSATSIWAFCSLPA